MTASEGLARFPLTPEPSPSKLGEGESRALQPVFSPSPRLRGEGRGEGKT
jgi:hypothetical protein